MKQKYHVCAGLLLDFQVSNETNNSERIIQKILEEEIEKSFVKIEKKLKDKNILLSNSMVEYIEGENGEPC